MKKRDLIIYRVVTGIFTLLVLMGRVNTFSTMIW